MSIVLALVGVFCLFTVLFDAFQTIILPRRATGRLRLTRIFYIVTWVPWRFFALRIRHPRRRETVFSYYGPASLILLFAVWAIGLVLGFALIYRALGSPFNDVAGQMGFRTDLYVSGTTLFTLGLGDVVPRSNTWVREVIILESATGLGLLAIVMGYFPVLYSAFSRREVSISLLDARAGSPPTAAELLRRHSSDSSGQSLSILLVEWERWSAELLESHISYPLLCYFRSQHTNQSWLAALTAILDTSALLIASVRGQEARQAQLTFAMARHALIDLAQIFSQSPRPGDDRLSPERYDQLYKSLCQSGVGVCRDNNSYDRLREMRMLYEGYAEALGHFLSMTLPPWMPDHARKDNWQSVAKLRAQTEAANGSPSAPSAADSVAAITTLADRHHDF